MAEAAEHERGRCNDDSKAQRQYSDGLQPRDLGEKRKRDEEEQEQREHVDDPLGNRRTERLCSRRTRLLLEHDDTRRLSSAGRKDAVEELSHDRCAGRRANRWSRCGLKEEHPSDGSYP
jgi:hypothetical protein